MGFIEQNTRHQHGGGLYSHPGFLDFSANINPLGPPWSVVSAAKSAMERVCCYPQVGAERLCQAISEMEQVEARQIFCGNGAAEVIFSLVLARKPKKALIIAPTFQEYERALRSVDCEIVFAYLHSENKFQLRQLPKNLDQTIDMVFCCNPNNPTGTLTGQKMMAALLTACEQCGALLVVDECFMDFVYDKGPTMKNFLRSTDHLFLVKAFTKTFGIPGLRLGYGLCRDEGLLARMQEVTQPWNVSLPAQEAGIAAAGETEFLEISRRKVEEEKQYLRKQLSFFDSTEKEGFFIAVYGDAANFIFFQSIPGLCRLLMEYQILIRDCGNFQGLRQGWYRIAVRTREENERLAEALRKIFNQKRNVYGKTCEGDYGTGHHVECGKKLDYSGIVPDISAGRISHRTL